MWCFFVFMAFYVYIIKSEPFDIYYKGFTGNPVHRMEQHNRGLSRYTAGKVPWRLVYVEERPTKKEALIREKVLKKYSHKQIELLLQYPQNIVGKFVS
jgi:putative endonuclease